MPCYHPITAYRSPRCVDLKSGKPKLFFKEIKVKAWPGYETLQVSCGQCIGCRLERSRQWAMRCVHEASLYDFNVFVTLTFDAKHLPPDGSLDVKVFQKFMKRLRKMASTNKNFKKSCRKKFKRDFLSVRFFHCGEYGDQLGRPHYHAILFDCDFPDKELWTIRNGFKLYRSKFLEKLWPFGFCTIGDVTFESSAYVARYCLKKINGDKAADHYKGRKPEYTTMSRGGRYGKGIAYGWFEKFKGDVFPCDNVVVRGKVLTPPKYYDRCLESVDPDALAEIKAKRVVKALANEADNTPERLKTKELCKKAQLSQLKRGYENET